MAQTDKNSASADYQVGRGKPPTHSRFRPGQSGNPGGRAKRSRNLKSVFRDVLEEEIEVTENGKKRKLSVLEALVKRAIQEALRGNMKACTDLLNRYERHVGSEPEHEEELTAEDKLILQRLMGVRTGIAKTRTGASGVPAQDYQASAWDLDEGDE